MRTTGSQRICIVSAEVSAFASTKGAPSLKENVWCLTPKASCT